MKLKLLNSKEEYIQNPPSDCASLSDFFADLPWDYVDISSFTDLTIPYFVSSGYYHALPLLISLLNMGKEELQERLVIDESNATYIDVFIKDAESTAKLYIVNKKSGACRCTISLTTDFGRNLDKPKVVVSVKQYYFKFNTWFDFIDNLNWNEKIMFQLTHACSDGNLLRFPRYVREDDFYID